MNSAYNGIVSVIALAVIVAPMVISAFLDAPQSTAPEEYDYR